MIRKNILDRYQDTFLTEGDKNFNDSCQSNIPKNDTIVDEGLSGIFSMLPSDEFKIYIIC